MNKYTDQQILDKVAVTEGFMGIPNGVWIVGIRSSADVYNAFDDKFFVYRGSTFLFAMSGTTNPGDYALKNFNKYGAKGAAVVKADKWYNDVWAVGMHKRRIKALVQVGSFDIIRDNNKNNASGDAGSVSSESGIGINLHPASYNLGLKTKPSIIGAWSAGCQVINDVQAFNRLMTTVGGQKRVSYCLLGEF